MAESDKEDKIKMLMELMDSFKPEDEEKDFLDKLLGGGKGGGKGKGGMDMLQSFMPFGGSKGGGMGGNMLDPLGLMSGGPMGGLMGGGGGGGMGMLGK